MCIAICSPAGNALPSEAYLKSSFKNNPDGAGFAFNNPQGEVTIIKGLMTWDVFKSTFDKFNEEFNFKNRGVLIHFRIQTHGGKVPECTHPFPMSDDPATLKKLENISPYGIIHNGIISLTSGKTSAIDHMSDTMIFIQKYLTKLATNKRWFYNASNFELIHDMIDSKMAILNGKGEIHMTAGFTKDTDGNWYSNNTYKEARPPKTANYYVPYYNKETQAYEGEFYRLPEDREYRLCTKHYGKEGIYNTQSDTNKAFNFFVNRYGDIFYANKAMVDNVANRLRGNMSYMGTLQKITEIVDGKNGLTLFKPQLIKSDFEDKDVFHIAWNSINYGYDNARYEKKNKVEGKSEPAKNQETKEKVAGVLPASTSTPPSDDKGDDKDDSYSAWDR